MQNTKTPTDPSIDAGINEDIKETVTAVLSREMYEGPSIRARFAKFLTIVLFTLAIIGIFLWWFSTIDPHSIVTEAFLQNKKIFFFNNCQINPTLQCVEHFFYDEGISLTLRNNAVSTIILTKVTLGTCIKEQEIELFPQEMTTVILTCPSTTYKETFSIVSLNPSSGLSTEKQGIARSSVEITGLYKLVDKSVAWAKNLHSKYFNPYLT